MSRDDLAAKLAGWVYERIATKGAQARLVRVLRTGDPDDPAERVPIDQVVLPAVSQPAEGDKVGFCTCVDGHRWADCGIPEHRALARLATGLTRLATGQPVEGSQ